MVIQIQFDYFFIKTYVVGSQYNRLTKALQMSTHNIGFDEKITNYPFIIINTPAFIYRLLQSKTTQYSLLAQVTL